MSRSWLLYLDDLIGAARKVVRFSAGRDAVAFASDEAAYDAVLYNLLVIGEAVKRLPEEATGRLSEAHRVGPARLRDLIAHRYFAIDGEIIWDVATRHVPALLVEAESLRDRLDAEPDPPR
jgi:uncharacterized protein with HEPN domain